jgi:hypothetical protein
MRARSRWLAAAAIVTACLVNRSALAGPSTPTANVEEASKHYERGLELYEEGADASALAELERAYQIAPNWRVLYELGIVELALHDFASALHHFEQYLDEGKEGVKRQRREEVTNHIAQLRQQVATIDVETSAGAEVRLDDVTVGTAPLASPLVVNAGHHKLGASKGGLAAESRAISVAGGDRTRIELVIPVPVVALPPPVAAPSLPSPEPAPPPPLPVASPAPSVPNKEIASPHVPPYPLWMGWAATGALAAGSVATGVEALHANANLTRAKSDGPSTSSTLSSLSSRAHAFAAASDVMTAGALVTGGFTLYFTLRGSRGAAAPTGANASLGLGLGRVAIDGVF